MKKNKDTWYRVYGINSSEQERLDFGFQKITFFTRIIDFLNFKFQSISNKGIKMKKIFFDPGHEADEESTFECLIYLVFFGGFLVSAALAFGIVYNLILH